MDRRSSRRRRLAFVLLGLFLLVAIGLAVAASTPEGRAVGNVLEYKLRKAWWAQVGVPAIDPMHLGSLSGVVLDEQGKPLAEAVVLISTVRGEVFQARSDAQGLYRIEGAPAGRYVPMAGAWGYEAVNGSPVRISAGQERGGVDFTLPAHKPSPVEPADLRIGKPRGELELPRADGGDTNSIQLHPGWAVVDNGQIYLPAQPPPEPKPTLVIVYPSHPLNWNAASVALTRDGNAVLAVGPDGDRGLDMAGHVRDYRAAVQLWQEGKLTPLGPPGERWVAMSGSFSSLILFPALRD